MPRPASGALDPLLLEAGRQGRVAALAGALAGSEGVALPSCTRPCQLVADVPWPKAVVPGVPYLADDAADELVATTPGRVALVVRALGVPYRAVDRAREVVVLLATVRRSNRLRHVGSGA